MSKSAILKSSIAKKWWMSLTGLFLCLFLVGHLLGNLQLVFIDGIDGKRAFNEYAYFMTHNPLIKVMSYITYLSILFHAIDGIMLTIQNKKARPINYVYNKPGENSSLPSRYMAVLGSAILLFIVIHMANFWGKMHFSTMPLHKETIYIPLTQNPEGEEAYYTTNGTLLAESSAVIAGETKLNIKDFTAEIQQQDPSYIKKGDNPQFAEGYKDLHSLTMAFFGHDKTKEGFPLNPMAPLAVVMYVLAMCVLGYHLWHGFASAFQTLGVNHAKYTPLIKSFGKAFSVLVPLAFALIPIMIFLSK